MPELSEILGAIVAGVTQARRIADEEAINVARRYQQEPLLKGLSVPRVRLPDVVIELPIIVQSYEPAQPAQLVDPDIIRESTHRFLIEQLTKQKPLPPSFGGSLNDVLSEEFKGISCTSSKQMGHERGLAKRHRTPIIPTVRLQSL